MRIVIATAGATLALAAPAQAAYAPKLSVTLSPATQSAAPTVTSVITQAPGETASKKVVVTFPPGFNANLGTKTTICSPDQANAKACPADSKIGTAEATASIAGLPQTLTGNVYFGQPYALNKLRLIVLLHNDILGDQHIEGVAELVPGGGARNTFDNLPDVLTTSFKLVLNGGEQHGLLRNPDTCGDFNVTASYTSQQGEQATGTAPVKISDCKPIPLAINDLEVSRSRVRFDVTVPATVSVTVKRNKKKVASGSFKLAKAGTAVVKTPKLKPGKYVFAIKITSADGRTLSKRYTRNVR